jgi:hypothetical protein
MTLQLLDDLLEPLGPRPFRQHHRLERAGIVGKRVDHDRHGQNRAWHAVLREPKNAPDSLCRSSARLQGNNGLPRLVNAPPVKSLQQR